MPPPLLLTTESASELDAHYATWLESAKGTAAHRHRIRNSLALSAGRLIPRPSCACPPKYSPTTPELRKLILQAATTEWLLLRLQRHADKILNPLFQLEMTNWTPVHHRQYQRTQRLLTRAENQLHKSRRQIIQNRRQQRQKLRAQRQAKSATQQPQ